MHRLHSNKGSAPGSLELGFTGAWNAKDHVTTSQLGQKKWLHGITITPEPTIPTSVSRLSLDLQLGKLTNRHAGPRIGGILRESFVSTPALRRLKTTGSHPSRSEAIALRSVCLSRIGGGYTVERCGAANDSLESLSEDAGVVLAYSPRVRTRCNYCKHI